MSEKLLEQSQSLEETIRKNRQESIMQRAIQAALARPKVERIKLALSLPLFYYR